MNTCLTDLADRGEPLLMISDPDSAGKRTSQRVQSAGGDVVSVDVAVLGGGHAGIEAAAAAARMGATVAIVTLSLESVGRLSCNPAIGGLAKGQLVREIDAMGGLMGLAADRAGIQYRQLNVSRGPAVRAPRAQVDRAIYPRVVVRLLREQAGDALRWIEGEATALLVDSHVPADRVRFGATARLVGLGLADGRVVRCGAAVLTTGTFLRGLMHRGERQTEGGRDGEPPTSALSRELRRLGFRLGRLKTGTPPRLCARSIDFDQLKVQPGDAEPQPFSFTTPRPFSPALPQVPCHHTHTTPAAHRAILDNLHRAPMFSGQIEGVGPRYCPSIEDKVVRFAGKECHQVFLEPEGITGAPAETIYANGISTSLPTDVQATVVAAMPGCERARILKYGYAVEYDFVPTDQIDATLHTKPLAGCFLAGQVNGTSGYEEAAAQGLLAGVNAVLWAGSRESAGDGFVLGRHEAYAGVLVDDLVTRVPTEPYRMFTSRAEHRLRLRGDTAELRLAARAVELGLIPPGRHARVTAQRARLDRALDWLRITPAREATFTALNLDSKLGSTRLADLLRRPDVALSDLSTACHDVDGASAMLELDSVDRRLLEADVKYEGYVRRQDEEIVRLAQLEAVSLPPDLDYQGLAHLRVEARQRLHAVRPRTLAQASRLGGVTPADCAVLLVHLRRRNAETASSRGP